MTHIQVLFGSFHPLKYCLLVLPSPTAVRVLLTLASGKRRAVVTLPVNYRTLVAGDREFNAQRSLVPMTRRNVLTALGCLAMEIEIANLKLALLYFALKTLRSVLMVLSFLAILRRAVPLSFVLPRLLLAPKRQKNVPMALSLLVIPL